MSNAVKRRAVRAAAIVLFIAGSVAVGVSSTGLASLAGRKWL